jgi:hypothetical protein
VLYTLSFKSASLRRPQLNIPSFVSQSLSYLAVLELGVACTDIQLSSHKLSLRWLYLSWQCVSYCWPDLQQAHIFTVGGKKNVEVLSHSNVQTADSSIHLCGTLARSALRYFTRRSNTRLSTPLQQPLPHTTRLSADTFRLLPGITHLLHNVHSTTPRLSLSTVPAHKRSTHQTQT